MVCVFFPPLLSLCLFILDLESCRLDEDIKSHIQNNALCIKGINHSHDVSGKTLVKFDWFRVSINRALKPWWASEHLLGLRASRQHNWATLHVLGPSKNRIHTTQWLAAILTQGPLLGSDRAASSISAGCGTAFKGYSLRKDIYYSMRKINKAFLCSLSAFGIKIPCFTHLAQAVATMSECCLGLITPCPQFRHFSSAMQHITFKMLPCPLTGLLEEVNLPRGKKAAEVSSKNYHKTPLLSGDQTLFVHMYDFNSI